VDGAGMKGENGGRVTRPISRWRLNNVRKVMRFLNADEKTARRILSEAIVAEKPDELLSDISDRLRRNLKDQRFSDEFIDKVEHGCRRLVRAGRLPALYGDPGVLDQRLANPNVVYVHASVHVPAWPQICAELEAIPEVMEASLVYGSTDVDAIIKVEASTERINEILMRDIQPLRHVLRTQTLQAVAYSRWQREQRAWELDHAMFERDPARRIREIGEDVLDARALGRSALSIQGQAYPDALKRLFEREMAGKLQALREIRDGRLTLKRSDSLETFPAMLVGSALRRIDAVVVVNRIPDGECARILRYLDAQHARIRQARGRFAVRRIFVVDGIGPLQSDEALQGRLGAEMYRGIEVRFLLAGQWPKARRAARPVDLGILDDSVCWDVLDEANGEQLRLVRLSLLESDILERQQDYVYLWDSASPLDDDLRRRCEAARPGFEYRCGGE
jgi:hypothetical protein